MGSAAANYSIDLRRRITDAKFRTCNTRKEQPSTVSKRQLRVFNSRLSRVLLPLRSILSSTFNASAVNKFHMLGVFHAITEPPNPQHKRDGFHGTAYGCTNGAPQYPAAERLTTSAEISSQTLPDLTSNTRTAWNPASAMAYKHLD